MSALYDWIQFRLDRINCVFIYFLINVVGVIIEIDVTRTYLFILTMLGGFVCLDFISRECSKSFDLLITYRFEFFFKVWRFMH